jgi:hypothetical protein
MTVMAQDPAGATKLVTTTVWVTSSAPAVKVLAYSVPDGLDVPPGIGAPELKLTWTGSTLRRRCCYLAGDTMAASAGTVIVAPLIDTNGDGRIDENDILAIIFTSFVNSIPYGSGAGGMIIRAI